MIGRRLRKREVQGYVQKQLIAPMLQLDEKERDKLFDGMLLTTAISMYNIANSELAPPENNEDEQEIESETDLDSLIAETLLEEDDYGIENYEDAVSELEEENNGITIYKPSDRINAANAFVKIVGVFENRKKQVDRSKELPNVIIPQDLKL